MLILQKNNLIHLMTDDLMNERCCSFFPFFASIINCVALFECRIQMVHIITKIKILIHFKDFVHFLLNLFEKGFLKIMFTILKKVCSTLV